MGARSLKKMMIFEGNDLKGFFAAMAEQAAYDYLACYKAKKKGLVSIVLDGEAVGVDWELLAAGAYLVDRFPSCPGILRLIESGALPARRSIHPKGRSADENGKPYSKENPKKKRKKVNSEQI